MLLLTRRVDEVIMIGDDVAIRVLGIHGNQVRLGIDAPKSVAVHRREVFDRIKREERALHAGAGVEMEEENETAVVL